MKNLTRATYIAMMQIGQWIMIAAAIAIPIWVTPGYYWWTAFLLITVLGDGYMIGKRMNLWEGEV